MPVKLRVEEFDKPHRMLALIYKRFDVIQLLSQGELSVTEIFVKMRIPQSEASQWMRELKSIGIVNSRRQGKNVFYSLNEEKIERIVDAISKI